jgi:hypothetical protein
VKDMKTQWGVEILEKDSWERKEAPTIEPLGTASGCAVVRTELDPNFSIGSCSLTTCGLCRYLSEETFASKLISWCARAALALNAENGVRLYLRDTFG